MRILLLFALFFVVLAGKKDAKKEKKVDLSHGFRTEIDWVPFDKAIGVAKDLNKPIFFLIHKTWCGACKNLRKEFNSNPKMGDLIEISKKFVMVNIEDDEEPEDAKYSPDGGYIPRILFLDTDGEPLETNNGKRYKNNAYFYPTINQVFEGMENGLKEFDELEAQDEAAANQGESAAEKPEDVAEEEEVKQEEKGEVAQEEKEEEKKEEVKEEQKETKKEKKEDKKEKDGKKEKKEKKDKKSKKEDKDEL